jgi:hypothetical protein
LMLFSIPSSGSNSNKQQQQPTRAKTRTRRWRSSGWLVGGTSLLIQFNFLTGYIYI